MSDDPLARQHVLRRIPPWRNPSDGLTECGLPSVRYPTITADEMRAKVKREGRHRASLSSCMTCWSAMDRASWVIERTGNPLFATLAREVESASVRDKAPVLLARELEAIALLIERHRSEFDQLLIDMAGAVDLREVRRQRGETPRIIV